MKYLLQTFDDDSHFSANRLGYFDDFYIASQYLDWAERRSSRKRLFRVSSSQFLNELPTYPFTVHRVVGKRLSPLGYFDTLKHADDFVHYYKSLFPFVKLIVSDHGLRTSSVDSESTLF